MHFRVSEQFCFVFLCIIKLEASLESFFVRKCAVRKQNYICSWPLLNHQVVLLQSKNFRNRPHVAKHGYFQAKIWVVCRRRGDKALNLGIDREMTSFYELLWAFHARKTATINSDFPCYSQPMTRCFSAMDFGLIFFRKRFFCRICIKVLETRCHFSSKKTFGSFISFLGWKPLILEWSIAHFSFSHPWMMHLIMQRAVYGIHLNPCFSSPVCESPIQ